MALEDDDLRASIESALDGADGGEGSAQTTPDPLVETPAAPEKPDIDASGKGAPTRDSMGRFLPKTAQEAPGAAETPPGTPALTPAPIAQPGAAQPAAQAIPAPASLSFGAREAWAQVPAAVQQEVVQREYQMQRFVNDTAPARQLGEKFWGTVQPYMGAIQAEGVDPITAVDNLLQFGTRMRMGTPAEKARTVANIVKAYGVGIEDLDAALVGQQVPERQNGADPQAVQQAVQQALMPLYQAAQQRQQRLQQQAQEQSHSEMTAFAAKPEHKYFEDLRPLMADLVEVAQRNGGDMSLEDAYQRAAMLHPEISKVMIAQRQGANAHQLTAAAQRAKAAAVSVNGSAPVGNPNVSEPTSVRESIEAAIEAHSRY